MTFTLIHACRGIAALLVALFHLAGAMAAEKYFNEPLFAQVLRFGSSGVEFFFVLSGFIIAHTHLKDIGRPAALGRFLARRAIRIYPAYWIIFAAVAAVALALPQFREGLPQTLSILMQSLALTPQDPALVGGTGAPLIIVAWSMQYELVFYGLFALFILHPGVGAAALGGMLLWWGADAAGAAAPFPLGFMVFHYFLIFAFGVLAAVILRGRTIPAPALLASTGFALYSGFAVFEGAEMVLGGLSAYPPRLPAVSLGFGAAGALIVLGLIGLETRRPRAIPAALNALGDASYVIYLLHFPIISAACKVLSPIGGGYAWAAFCFALILGLICAASIAFHYRVERPILHALRRPTTARRALTS